ncbi:MULTISPECIES: phage portal protein [Bacillaceae]|uniref:Phage portal protein n=1 Tax=Evansella alkalicola TaxID=745819 RepID=A0ABS6K114_9BACI|nr:MULTISPECIES: phage portal protein [Bacillaceae]MBU9724132.1 phage portal protein [Bacillus alkalicola]
MFSKIFGNKKQAESTFKRFELINDSSTTFYSWDGNLFDNDIVRSCVRPKANAIGKLNAKHIRGHDENMVINPDPHIREILQNPNPYMSMQDFLMKMILQRELNHNAFAYVKRDPLGHPEEIYPLPASSVELLEKGGEMFAKFRFRTGKYIVVPYEDIIHLRKDFYDHDFFGSGGVHVLKPVMEVITTTDQGVVNAIKNSAVIRWLLKFKNVLKPEDKKIQVKEFVDNYLQITNEGGAAASDPRYEVEQVNNENYVPNAEQMEKSVQRLYAYFGVNEKIVQNKFTEDEWNAFYESELEPPIIQLSNAFTNVFFTKRERGYGNKILFESSNLAYASMKTKLSLVQMVDRGALVPNKWNEIMGLPPVEGGNKPIRRLDTATVEDGDKFVKEVNKENEQQSDGEDSGAN